MKILVATVVALVIAPSLFVLHLYGAMEHNLVAMIAPIPLAMLLHLVYPLHKIDEAFT